MASQKAVFLRSEGDEWFRRNQASLESALTPDLVPILESLKVMPATILEIGCCSGGLLERLRIAFGAECYGVEPSACAIEQGRTAYPRVKLRQGTAEALDFQDDFFSLVIFGFCLYLCDREDLFKIAFEADRCLCDGGHLVITDFEPPFPYANRYIHHEGLLSYHMMYADMFTWNPAYQVVAHVLFKDGERSDRDSRDSRASTTVLRKRLDQAHLIDPFEDTLNG